MFKYIMKGRDVILMSDETTKYTKEDLVNSTAEKLELPKKLVKSVVNSVFEDISDIVVEGGTVTIQRFGRFFSKEAKPRSFRKIHSNEIVEVGARDLPKIKFSKKLISRVKGE